MGRSEPAAVAQQDYACRRGAAVTRLGHEPGDEHGRTVLQAAHWLRASRATPWDTRKAPDDGGTTSSENFPKQSAAVWDTSKVATMYRSPHPSRTRFNGGTSLGHEPGDARRRSKRSMPPRDFNQPLGLGYEQRRTMKARSSTPRAFNQPLRWDEQGGDDGSTTPTPSTRSSPGTRSVTNDDAHVRVAEAVQCRSRGTRVVHQHGRGPSRAPRLSTGLRLGRLQGVGHGRTARRSPPTSAAST